MYIQKADDVQIATLIGAIARQEMDKPGVTDEQRAQMDDWAQGFLECLDRVEENRLAELRVANAYVWELGLAIHFISVWAGEDNYIWDAVIGDQYAQLWRDNAARVGTESTYVLVRDASTSEMDIVRAPDAAEALIKLVEHATWLEEGCRSADSLKQHLRDGRVKMFCLSDYDLGVGQAIVAGELIVKGGENV